MKSSVPFSGSAGVFDWLSQFINIDRGQSTKSFRLDRSEILAEMAGHPERSARVIHVAGSKGKGSVTGMITAILEEGGLKTARYTSPHVTEYRERITLGNRFFDEVIYTAAGEELRRLVDTLSDPGCTGYRLFNPGTEEGEAPTFFELLTIYFFMCAALAECDAMVVETGIGGRLDATNIVEPLVSVITSIELEHTEFLGETVTEIAREKAGIIKKGRPLILMEQDDETLAVFKQAAAAQGSPLVYFPDAARIEELAIDQNSTTFSLDFKTDTFFPSPLALSIPIPGAIQAQNAGLAVLAVKTAFPGIGAPAIEKSLRSFTLPARFERIRDDPPFVIDGAHTPHSTAFCTGTFTTLYGRGGILLFGCAVRKDALTMAKTLVPQFSRIIITTPGTFKISNPEQVYAVFQKILDDERGAESPGKKAELIFIKDTNEAIARTLELGSATGLPVLATGSFYLASEIRNAVTGRAYSRSSPVSGSGKDMP
ncbi:bifunctional folylpolyglutamate synthase/dihydrofolate synthase [Spirochaetia bacterium]|nr:bifunctional folylpolyglutamate synthase/dihydrofolate synthase [Spirochaetia bacterium]